jgi:hypothetical protein
MPRVRSCLFLLLSGLLLSHVAFAQRDLGAITGTITDPSGAGVSNARVSIVEQSTGLSYEVQADQEGTYVRPLLPPGTYIVTVESAGFQKAQQKDVLVTPNGRTAANITMQVGDVNQTIEVTAAAPLLQTENTTLGTNLGSAQVSQLPLGGQRTFTFLARLSPGVVPAEPGARDAVGGGFSANGVRSNGSNNFLLNGVDNNVNVIDFLNQASFVIGPPPDAIGEFQVLTNGYNAEYGRGAGGVLDINIKTGTNKFTGVVWEILQNDKLNANRWETNRAGQNRGPFRQNQFGGAIGGPILKNKLFFFGDYQGTRIASSGGSIQNLGNGGFYTIPTQDMVNGNFSALLGGRIGTDALGRPILQNAVYDPTTTRTVNGQLVRDMFQGNQIPVTRMDPAALKIAQLYPATNQPILGGNFPQNSYYIITPGRQNVDSGDGRIDYRITDKDSIFGSVSWSNANKVNTPPLPGALDFSAFNGNTEQNLGRNAQLGYTRVWAPNLISETRIGFSRMVTSRTQYGADIDQFTAFGIGGYNPTGPLNGGLPQIGLGRYTQIGASNWLPSKEYSNVWDFIQNVSLISGSHSLKFGGEFRPIKFPFFQVPYPHGQMDFNRNETAYPSNADSANGLNGTLNTDTGDEIASFLLGSINGGQISTTNFISSQKVAWAFYVQDDWKVTPKLTLNLGVRYELFSPIGEKFGRQSNFNYDTLTLDIPAGKDQNTPLPASFATSFPNVNVNRGGVDQYLIPWDKTNVGPRFGIAYNIFPKTVIRTSYGIFYSGEENQGGNPNRGESAPFNFSPNLTRPSGVGTFAPNPYFANGNPTGGVSAGYPLNVFTGLPVSLQFRSLAQNFRNGMVQKWNFAIQQQLPSNFALEVAYVGNHQSHGLLQPDQNACPNFGTLDTTINCNSLRPVPFIQNLSGTASFGYGNYHAMTAKLDKRMSSGLQFVMAYTYGHALANSGTTLSGSDGIYTRDPRNYGSSYASASWDIRHNFTTGLTYELPFGKGKQYGASMNGLMQMLLGNWQLNSILTFRTGSPYTLRANGCQGVWNGCSPDIIAGASPDTAPAGGRNPSQWFDTSVFRAPATLTQGSVGLQTNNAPPTRNVDLSIFKDFPFTERYRIQFRAETFNLGNTPQYSRPNYTLGDATFGQVTSTQAGSERKVQFALRFLF